MTTQQYEEYLQSEAWRIKRRMLILFRGVKRGWQLQCERCLTFVSRKKIHIHHATYCRLGNEALDDLEILCESCHDKEHGITPECAPGLHKVGEFQERLVENIERRCS